MSLFNSVNHQLSSLQSAQRKTSAAADDDEDEWRSGSETGADDADENGADQNDARLANWDAEMSQPPAAAPAPQATPSEGSPDAVSLSHPLGMPRLPAPQPPAARRQATSRPAARSPSPEARPEGRSARRAAKVCFLTAGRPVCDCFAKFADKVPGPGLRTLQCTSRCALVVRCQRNGGARELWLVTSAGAQGFP